MSELLFNRRCKLLVTAKGRVLDLSDFRIKFKVEAQDEEHPNNAAIRVYNLSPQTIAEIRKNFVGVVLQAGYGDAFGVIFDGTIKQYRIGRENATDTYCDILAADGDLGYNWGTVNTTLAAGSTPVDRIKAVASGMAQYDVKPPDSADLASVPNAGGILPRGKVLFGMARTMMRDETATQRMTWGIYNGRLQIAPLDSYQPGTAVVLTGETGLIGRPEQTSDGIKARCLINPRIVLGGLVKIDNKTINQTVAQSPTAAGLVPYNQYAGVQMLADIASDGIYRVYVAEYEGDTFGQPFYCDLTLLAVDPVSKTLIPGQ